MTEIEPSEPRRRLSVAMIVRDAADMLTATFDSVRAIADEIVVCDTGSSDATLAIADGGADIADQIEWQDDNSAARNECLSRITGNWVLWLEAGETLDDLASQQLRSFVDEAAERNKAYLLFLQRPASSSATSADQMGQLRLLPHRPELRFVGRVRETILPSVLAAEMGVDALDCIIQLPQLDSESERARARRNLNLANLSLTENANQASPLLARAEALAQLGRPKESGEAYRNALDVAERGSSEMLEAYFGLLTTMDDNQSAAEVQINTCLEALEVFPLDSQLLCGMGSYLLRSRRLDLAAHSYEMAVRHGKVDPSIWHLADLADVAVTCWSLVLQLLGDNMRAETVLSQTVAERPDSVRLRRQLIELYVKAGRERDATEQCQLLPDDLPWRNEIPSVVRGAALVAAKKAAAGLGPLRRAFQAGCRDLLCLRWLAAANLAVSDFSELEVVVAEWERHEPGNLEIAAFRQAAMQSKVTRHSAEKSRRVDGTARPGGLPIEPPKVTPPSASSRI
jgi:tetratricopeptide (TPR) repeat protein